VPAFEAVKQQFEKMVLVMMSYQGLSEVHLVPAAGA
jgi:hypothetical protein